MIDIMADKSKSGSLDLGLLEEDDEFEEFPAEDWTAKDQDDEDISVWEDNWDDDNVEDDFSKLLKIELGKPLAEDKKKRTNADVAMELRTREANAQRSQQMVKDEIERKRIHRKVSLAFLHIKKSIFGWHSDTKNVVNAGKPLPHRVSGIPLANSS